MQWKIVILLIMLAYPLAQTAEVHGDIVRNTETVAGGLITFSISAGNQTVSGDPLSVTLSVTGNWSGFYGFLYYNGTLFKNQTLPDGMIGPVYNGYDITWSGMYNIPGLDVGCYNLTFWAKYWPKLWEFPPWYGPIPIVTILVYVVLPTPPPPPPSKPTLYLKWLTPLSRHNSFEAGRTIPIRFSVQDETGNFYIDQSVTVTVTGPGGSFFAKNGTDRDDVRIRESAEYYIVYWKTPRTPGEYSISVKFQGVQVPSLPISLSVGMH